MLLFGYIAALFLWLFSEKICFDCFQLDFCSVLVLTFKTFRIYKKKSVWIPGNIIEEFCFSKKFVCGELNVTLWFFFFFRPQVFGDYYHFRHRTVVKRSLSEHRGTHIRLHTDPQVCVKCRIRIRLIRTAPSRFFFFFFTNKLKGFLDQTLSKKPKH